jgi:hypothetical protein
MSEYESVPGFADIFLQRNPDLPQIRFEWIWEIKYLKSGEESKAPQKMKEAQEQLNKYLQAFRLAGRPGLHGAAIVFIGKNKFEIYIQKQ